MIANPAAPRGSVLSILHWRDAHLASRPFPFTLSVSDVYGLHAALEQYLREGGESVRRRQPPRRPRGPGRSRGPGPAAVRQGPGGPFRYGHRGPGAPGFDERAVRAHAREESGVMLSGGQGELAGAVLQIGHMGTGAYPLAPVIAITALGRALRSLGARPDIGAGVEAAVAALAELPPARARSPSTAHYVDYYDRKT